MLISMRRFAFLSKHGKSIKYNIMIIINYNYEVVNNIHKVIIAT
jgi:hypothetical protein